MADEKDKKDAAKDGAKEGTEDAATPGKAKKKGLKFAILGGIVLVVGAGMFFLVTEVVAPMFDGEDAAEVDEEVVPAAASVPGDGSGLAYELGEIITNPAGTGARRYIKVSVTLEYANEAHKGELEKRAAFVKDVIIRELTSRTVDELTDPVSKDEMREGMVQRLNQLFSTDPITGVHFTEYVIQ